MPDQLRFEHDIEAQYFEAFVGESRAFIEYRSNKEGKIFLVHTEVPENLRGQRIGEALAEYAFKYIRDAKLKMVPMCPFIKAYLKRHPEHMDLLPPGIEVR